jgi:hypothetical protein
MKVGGKLVSSGSKKSLLCELLKSLEVAMKDIAKLSKVVFGDAHQQSKTTPEKRQENQKALIAKKFYRAYLDTAITQVREIERTAHDGTTYEYFGWDANKCDPYSAFFFIMHGLTIVAHSSPLLVIKKFPLDNLVTMDLKEELRLFDAMCVENLRVVGYTFKACALKGTVGMSSPGEGLIISGDNMNIKYKHTPMDSEPGRGSCVYNDTCTRETYFAMVGAKLQSMVCLSDTLDAVFVQMEAQKLASKSTELDYSPYFQVLQQHHQCE